MKGKKLTALILALMLTLLYSVGASAVTIYDYGNWSFLLIGEDEYEVYECLSDSAEITVPYQVDQYRVTSVGSRAFADNSTVTSVKMKAPMSAIGDHAFANCEHLTDVYIPDSVSSISDTAFLGSENIVIRCEKDSFAYAYALEHQLTAHSPRLLGDSDDDGEVGIPDVTAIQRYLARMQVEKPECVESYGDVDGNGVDIMDATQIQRWLSRLSVDVNIGEPIW